MFTSGLDSSGGPLLESEWTLETGSRVREDTGYRGLEEGEFVGAGPPPSLNRGVGVSPLGCSLLLTQVAGSEAPPCSSGKLTSRPAALGDFGQGTVSFHPAGLAGPDECGLWQGPSLALAAVSTRVTFVGWPQEAWLLLPRA